MSVYSLKIGGEAGQGVKSTGLLIAKMATRSGYSVYTYSEYPSLIRGGHNVMQIVWSRETVTSPIRAVNLLIAFNDETINLHKDELVAGAGIIYDVESKLDKNSLSSFKLFPAPLTQLAKEAGGQRVVGNTVAAGVMTWLLGADMDQLVDLLTESFSSKAGDLAKINIDAAKKGFEYARDNFERGTGALLEPILDDKSKRVLVNGNQAMAVGAIEAGMQFASIYPMTPITSILEMLAKYQAKYGYIYKQPEDEIAAINMAIGASYAGARSMVATSGGGFCLMTEGLGLAAMTETPLVIIEGMRTGPATGMPTWTEQGDLRMVLHAHQGDFPRIVVAAGDAAEAYQLTMSAFNWAEKYQLPVIILVDKHICECDQSYENLLNPNYVVDRGKQVTEPTDYQRYALSEDGVSPRALPGNGIHLVTNSDEHDALGYDNEEAENRVQQMNKRLQKLVTIAKNEYLEPELIGPKNAKLTIVSWGSTKGSILEALKIMPEVNFLKLTWINPFPANTVKKILSEAKIILNIETNSTGQMTGLIAEKTGITIENNLLKNDGRPIYPEEVVARIKKLLTQL